MKPIPFDPVNDGRLLAALGYEHEHIPEEWFDVGDAENGPKLDGHPAFDVWTLGNHEVVVADGEIVAHGRFCPDFDYPDGDV